MGCCNSRPSDDSTPAVRAHSSSRNITAPSTRSTSPHPSQGNIDHSRNQEDAVHRPNTPLKPIPAAQRSRLPNTLASSTANSSSRLKPMGDSTNLAWTRAQLEKERQDWWDTQVTGSQEIWGAIRLAAQHLQTGELQEAQTMLDATGCTCPTGLLWKGVYDPTGVQYKVPEWVVVEPQSLADESDVQGEAATGQASASALRETVPGSADDTDDGPFPVRVRTSNNQKDVVIDVRRHDPASTIVEKLKKQTNLVAHVHVRLAYGGRVYQDHETLEAQQHWNFANNFILTALVFETPTAYLTFLLNAHIYTFDELGIVDPNLESRDDGEPTEDDERAPLLGGSSGGDERRGPSCFSRLRAWVVLLFRGWV